VGTVLLKKVFQEICFELNWRFEGINGKPHKINKFADIILFQHSLVDEHLLYRPHVGVRFIRDPRDIIVSGYLYHRRCKELWCVNTNFQTKSPILFPHVPYSQEHRPEEWKKKYLSSLENKSYQQNLLDRDESEGLLFEMNHYGRWTIENMLNWKQMSPSIETIRFETLMNNYDETFKNMFTRFGFSEKQISKTLSIAAKEDLNRKNDTEIQSNTHISSRQTTKWKAYFKDIHKDAFKQLFGDALIHLGYEDFD